MFISVIVSRLLVVLVLITIHLFKITSILIIRLHKEVTPKSIFATNYFEQRIFTSNWVIKPKRTNQFKIFPKLTTFSWIKSLFRTVIEWQRKENTRKNHWLAHLWSRENGFLALVTSFYPLSHNKLLIRVYSPDIISLSKGLQSKPSLRFLTTQVWGKYSIPPIK